MKSPCHRLFLLLLRFSYLDLLTRSPRSISLPLSLLFPLSKSTLLSPCHRQPFRLFIPALLPTPQLPSRSLPQALAFHRPQTTAPCCGTGDHSSPTNPTEAVDEPSGQEESLTTASGIQVSAAVDAGKRAEGNWAFSGGDEEADESDCEFWGGVPEGGELKAAACDGDGAAEDGVFDGARDAEVVAEHLPVEEIDGIKQMFHMMDTDKKGKLTIEELKKGLHILEQHIPELDIHMLMEASPGTDARIIYINDAFDLFHAGHVEVFIPHQDGKSYSTVLSPDDPELLKSSSLSGIGYWGWNFNGQKSTYHALYPKSWHYLNF